MPTRWIYNEVSNTWTGDFNADDVPQEDRPEWLAWPYTVKQIPKMRTRDLREVYYSFLRSAQNRDGYVSNDAANDAWNREMKKLFPDMEPFKRCMECVAPAAHADLKEPRPGHFVDADCYAQRWGKCPHCEKDTELRTMIQTGERRRVCSKCLETEGYVACGDCNSYWHPDSNHHHPQCCESPQQLFTIRNDGGEPLANDTRVTIEFAEKRIDSEGINRIYNLLRNYKADGGYVRSAAGAVNEMDPRWQMKSGNFTKRLQSLVYKNYKVKLPPEIVSEVGNIATQHTAQAGSVDIEITRNLNRPAREFGNAGSCWWGGYSSSRCALKSNGGFGLRSFDKDGNVKGRCWVLPLKFNKETKKFKQTFNTMEADAFFAFNGYGDLAGYEPARLLAHMQGVTYKKIGFRPTDEGWYINNGSGFLIAPEDMMDMETVEIPVRHHSNLYAEENK